MGGAAADLAVICVTHNSAPLIDAWWSALPAALGGLRSLVIFVDSASTDGTVATVRDRAPDARVVALDANRGFSAGINAGVRHAGELGGADAYAVVNPDIVLEPGCLTALARALREPGVGIAAPRLHDEHATLLPSLRRAPRLAATCCDAIIGGPMAARLGLPTEVIRDLAAYECDRVVGWATGGMLAISDACRRAVGEWDESFFMYEEEVDFALRAAAAGFALRYVASASAIRTIGPAPVAPWAHALMRANRVRLARRWSGAAVAAATRLALLLGESARAAMGRRAARAAVWALFRQAGPAAIMARYRPDAGAVIGTPPRAPVVGAVEGARHG